MTSFPEKTANTVVPEELLFLHAQVVNHFIHNHNGDQHLSGIAGKIGSLPVHMAKRACEMMYPCQIEEINRVYKAFPYLNDHACFAENLHRWMA